MKLPLISKQDSDFSAEKLEQYYSNNMIPAEKKKYLTSLENSMGPYLATIAEDGKSFHYLMDAASQIATLGLGFSPAVFMGVSHFLESWLNNPHSQEFQELRKAFHRFLQRKTDFQDLHMTFCHSGAEANEMALGYCYQKRKNKQANKVLAFEGSFHGRMLISLSSTWNKVKREPFEWDGHTTEYCFAPEDINGVLNHEFPKDWAKTWDQAPSKEFKTPTEWSSDTLLKKETQALKEVRLKLLKENIFSIIIEPMQCEGGDRYITNRFHSALLLMAQSFRVPVIYDEVQTGFHLGKEFFWHKELHLKGIKGETLKPDYIICAKKAQLGLVLSQRQETFLKNGLQEKSQEEFQVASAIRGYFHGIALDQAQEKIIKWGEKSSAKLASFINKFQDFLENPRANGLAFSFDFKDSKNIAEFIKKRFDHGLLYYPAGSKTLRFRLNISFSDLDLDFLFERLEAMAQDIFFGKKEKLLPTEVKTTSRPIKDLYRWHNLLLSEKLKSLFPSKSPIQPEKTFPILKELFQEHFSLEIVEITKVNFSEFEQKINELQQQAYEPTRQTDMAIFKKTAEAENSICLALVSGNSLAGMAFSAPLKTNPLERGVRQDPHFENPKALYMIDTTINKEHKGQSIGRYLKYALYLIAQSQGIERIHGRNRDRLASQMMSINLSLGAYELFYMKEDYPDFESHRDVFYYTSPLLWKRPLLNLTDLRYSPLGVKNLSEDYLKEQLPCLINKVCLSNFVSERFLEHVSFNFGLIHKNLRHGYTTSGQSECVDKIIKTLWVKASEPKKKKLLTFKGHHFGNGSFLSRSLSQEEDPFFSAKQLAHPTQENFKEVLKEVKKELRKGSYLSIWIEPIRQNFMDFVPFDFLIELKRLSKHFKTPLIYNETNSGFYKYNQNSFFAANDEEITPDCVMAYLGGQAGQVFIREDFFLSDPLMMISTWDGDEFSFSNYHLAAKEIIKSSNQFHFTKQSFEKQITKEIEKYQVQEKHLKNGIGWFSGIFPSSFTKHFECQNGRYLINPTSSSMEQFIKKGFSHD